MGLLPLVVVDYTICASLCKDAGGRWFLLHALGNLVVAVMSLPDIYFWFLNPPGAMSVAYCQTLPFPGCSDWPTCLIISMHVYHMISFKLNGDGSAPATPALALPCPASRPTTTPRLSRGLTPHASTTLTPWQICFTTCSSCLSSAGSTSRTPGAWRATSSPSSSPASPAVLTTLCLRPSRRATSTHTLRNASTARSTRGSAGQASPPSSSSSLAFGSSRRPTPSLRTSCPRGSSSPAALLSSSTASSTRSVSSAT